MSAVRRLADARSAALDPAIPLAVWCRPTALLILRERERPRAGFAPARSRPSGSRLTDHVRLMYRAIMIRGCLLAARLAILAARLLLLMGLLTSEDAASALRWSSRLIVKGMLLWRQRR